MRVGGTESRVLASMGQGKTCPAEGRATLLLRRNTKEYLSLLGRNTGLSEAHSYLIFSQSFFSFSLLL
jgi:hypothetical protein